MRSRSPSCSGRPSSARLTARVTRLAGRNLDLNAATERVVPNAAQRQVIASRALPNIEGRSIDFYNRPSQNGISSVFQLQPHAPQEFPLYQQGLQLSWELDLFGRVRRAVAAQDATTLASVESRNGVALAALAEMAQSYVQLRGVQARIAVAQRNLALAREDIALVDQRFANGVGTTLDRAQAVAQEAMIEQTLPPADAAGGARQHDRLPPRRGAPRPGGRASAAEGAAPPAAHGGRGTARDAARCRPDVREAEARLHAGVAETGAAEAQFYRDINQIGTVNVQSLRLSDLFTLPSRAFIIGPDITIPISEGGRLRANLALRESQQRGAAVAFQRTVLRAWQETDNALTAHAGSQRRTLALIRAVAQNEIALSAARQRYIEGLVDFLDVDTTHSQFLRSQNELADSHVPCDPLSSSGRRLAVRIDRPGSVGRVSGSR